MIKEYFSISVRNLKTRPLRSWLTIIGIVIGIFLIVVLISLGSGMEGAINKQLQMMGPKVVNIFPGEISNMMTRMTGSLKLSDEDIEAVKKVEGVEKVLPMLWKANIIRYEEKKQATLIAGVPWKEGGSFLQEDMGWSLEEGAWPEDRKREILLGNAVKEDIFSGVKIGQDFYIEGRPFEVVGFLESLGNKQDDSMVYIDLPIFRKITGEREGAQIIMAKISEEASTDATVEEIEENLEETRRRKRGSDLPSFSVLTSEKASEMFNQIMGLIQAFVYGIASIAILVGGIGIMNTMYTSVRERTREVGVMKAVGAKDSTVITLFLIESGIIGLLGGLGGIILGLGVAKVVEIILQAQAGFFIQASITPGLIIFGLLFSFVLGCLSGFFPARQASQLDPADALRYE